MSAPAARVIAALPVDARPAVRSQVQAMVACAHWSLRVPPVGALGHLREPADRDALRAWLLEQAREAAGVVVSLDMLVYGGLVPSRFIEDPLQALLARLDTLRLLREAAPARPIFAFAATMRISDSDVAEEEKPYWAEHGRQLWAWSYHGDRARRTGAADSAALARAAEAAVPAAVREDYLATRQRNFALTRHALQLVARGVIDRLVLPQDDTAEYGLNVAERLALEQEATALGVADRVAVYAGADEVLHTLCARLVAQLEGRAPLRVALLPSDPGHVGALRARYEDRPVLQSVAAQARAAGATLCDAPDDADVLLALHTQGHTQGDWALDLPLPQRVPVPPAWFEALRSWLARGRPLALADLAYANGGDPWLLAQLREELPQLAAYAGWNTAGNSLGSVLAQSVLGCGREHEAASRHALALRLLEDGLYQGQLRQALRRAVDEARATPAALLEAARALVVPQASAWAVAHGLGWRVADVALPWGRTFEIDLMLEPAPAGPAAMAATATPPTSAAPCASSGSTALPTP